MVNFKDSREFPTGSKHGVSSFSLTKYLLGQLLCDNIQIISGFSFLDMVIPSLEPFCITARLKTTACSPRRSGCTSLLPPCSQSC